MLEQNNAPQGYTVYPRSINDIRNFSQKFRDWLGIETPQVDVIKVLEVLALEELLDYTAVESRELTYGELGNTKLIYNGKDLIPFITLDENVFNGADTGHGFDRFTVAHELGHALMHSNELKLSRSIKHREVKTWYEDSEWQANTFASEFLADLRYITKDDDMLSIASKFGVSFSCAKIRIDKLRKKGEI